MQSLIDLKDVSQAKVKSISLCLEELLTSKVITGYNWYDNSFSRDHNSIIFSHLHDDEEYKKAMVKDLTKLSYDLQYISERIRGRGTAYFPHKLEWLVLDNLNLKNIKDQEYLDLSEIKKGTSLVDYQGYDSFENCLIGENFSGWEINLPFTNSKELSKVIRLFLKKTSSIHPKSWPLAYRTPVLIISSEDKKYENIFSEFNLATKFVLTEGKNEISFIISKKLEKLRKLSIYNKIKKLGFIEESCLVNNLFLEEYVDWEEKY